MEKLLMKAASGRSMAKAACWPKLRSSLTTSASTVVRLYLSWMMDEVWYRVILVDLETRPGGERSHCSSIDVAVVELVLAALVVVPVVVLVIVLVVFIFIEDSSLSSVANSACRIESRLLIWLLPS